jgi:signal peptidase II
MRKKQNNFSLFIIIFLSVIALDQLLKILIVKGIIPLAYSKNTGAGFSLFQNQVSILVWVSFIVIGAILYFYDSFAKDRVMNICFALIFGGAIGNLIDRIRLGYVIDFIDLKVWPSFNIADSAITLGTIILLVYLIRAKKD